MRGIHAELYYRYRQVFFLKYFSKTVLTAYDGVRLGIPTLNLVSLRAVRKLDPFSFGEFASSIRRCVETTTMFLLVHKPSQSQKEDWAKRLKSKFVSTDFECLNMLELVNALDAVAKINRMGRPKCTEFEESITRSTRLFDIEMHNFPIVELFMRSWMARLHRTMHRDLTFIKLVKMSRGFGQGQLRYWGVRNEGAEPIANLGLPEVTYKSVGARIFPDEFCTALAAPVGTICSICARVIDNQCIGQEGHSVLTSCRHWYHVNCLDTWVNNSAQASSNLCPTCRAVMCECRPRVPV